MTPEERLNKIEALLQASAEQQEKQNEVIRGLAIVADKHGHEIEKQNEGIRSLIVVARTCLDSIKEMRDRHDSDHERMLAEIDKLREAQAASDERLNILIEHESALDQAQTRTDGQIQELRQAQLLTDEKLKALIDTVDRIIRRNGKE